MENGNKSWCLFSTLILKAEWKFKAYYLMGNVVLLINNHIENNW